MNDILSKTLLYISFISIFILASCSSSSKTTRDYTKNKRAKTYINKEKSKPARIAKAKPNRSTSKTKKRSRSKKSVSSDSRNQVIYFANTMMGIPYIYGGKSPMGFDCSGFTSYVYTQRGISLYGNTNSQAKQGRKISLKNAQKGDLLFFGKSHKISHVAIIEKNTPTELIVIHSTSSKGVIRQNIKNSKYWTPRILYAVDVLDAKDKFASK